MKQGFHDLRVKTLNAWAKQLVIDTDWRATSKFKIGSLTAARVGRLLRLESMLGDIEWPRDGRTMGNISKAVVANRVLKCLNRFMGSKDPVITEC